MSSANPDTGALLEAIPPSQLKPEQVPHWSYGKKTPTYKLLRDPISLKELSSLPRRMAIWRNNQTLVYVLPRGTHGFPESRQKALFLVYFDDIGKDLQLCIVGETDDAIAQTAAFFMGSVEPTEKKGTCLVVRSQSFNNIDFRAAGSQCLRKFFDAIPSCDVRLFEIMLSAEQSTTLACRSHPIDLTFWKSKFEDGGTAFVDALENRKSPFGSLEFNVDMGFNDENVKRLLKVNLIGHLRLPLLKNELAVLPLYAPVDFLDYTVDASFLVKDDFQSANIVAKKLSVTAVHDRPNSATPVRDRETFLTSALLSLLRRVADMGHFLELRFELETGYFFKLPDCVIDELFRAMHANANLQTFEWCDIFSSRIEPLCTCLKEHKGLTSLKLDIYSDGSSIDELYSLNRFYLGSAGLVVVPPSERALLVVTALMERASNDFQRAALLLSNHADALCELVQFSRLDELEDAAPATPTTRI